MAKLPLHKRKSMKRAKKYRKNMGKAYHSKNPLKP